MSDALPAIMSEALGWDPSCGVRVLAILPGMMCSGIVNQADYVFGDNVCKYGAAGPGWSTFNLAQQGAIVDSGLRANVEHPRPARGVSRSASVRSMSRPGAAQAAYPPAERSQSR
jgi:hypothetical protein